MQPEFSLVLPVFNVAAYLERCLESILVQDIQDCEIILVDDGSTDASASICDAYAVKYPEITVIHQPNGGLSNARNTGLAAANGRYVWFIDSDDWIMPDAMAVLRHACKNQQDVIKFGYCRVEDSRTWEQPCRVQAGLYEDAALEELRNDAFREPGRYGLSAWAHVYRRELLLNNGLVFTSERLVCSEDYLFNLQMLLCVRSVEVLEHLLYCYELRVGSLSQTIKKDLPQRYTELYHHLRLYYQRNAALERYGRFIDRFYVWHLIYGTCFDDIYRHSPTREEMRRSIRGMLGLTEMQNAIRNGDCTGLSVKKRIQLMAMRLRWEGLFYYLFVTKPKHRKQKE